MKQLLTWLADVYRTYGWQAVMIIVAVFTLLFTGLVLVLDLDPSLLWAQWTAL